MGYAPLALRLTAQLKSIGLFIKEGQRSKKERGAMKRDA